MRLRVFAQDLTPAHGAWHGSLTSSGPRHGQSILQGTQHSLVALLSAAGVLLARVLASLPPSFAGEWRQNGGMLAQRQLWKRTGSVVTTCLRCSSHSKPPETIGDFFTAFKGQGDGEHEANGSTQPPHTALDHITKELKEIWQSARPSSGMQWLQTSTVLTMAAQSVFRGALQACRMLLLMLRSS